ncbi:MAG: glycosyltransferase family 2 protein, partial [Ramlibacter sp.]
MIPAYRVSRQIISVIEAIGPEIGRIYVVDDQCPERSGDLVRDQCTDARVVVLRHATNQGVGGA